MLQAGRYLGMGKSAEVRQFDHGPVFGPQRLERLVENPPLKLGGCEPDGVGRVIRGDIQRLHLAGRALLLPALAPPDLVDGPVADDTEQSGGHLARPFL